MIELEEVMDIWTYHRQGLSIREISRKTGLHRQTVKKYIAHNDVPRYNKRKRNDSILAPYQQYIDAMLKEDAYKATWLFERIKALGYTGGYDTLKIYVRKIKRENLRTAYIRFETMPGHQGQVDWAEFQIQRADGSTTKVYAFIMVLGFSRAMYVELVPECSLEAFMDCHIHAFEYLQGVPSEILYDNMSQFVTHRKGGAKSFNIEFLHFAHHYGFTPNACPAYSPWIKGKVERPVDYIRERFWRGFHFSNVKDANQQLLQWLNEQANQRVHGTHRQPVAQLWSQEIKRLGSLPRTPYDTSLKVYRKVYKDCRVSYNCNLYVLPAKAVGKRILLKIKNGVIRFYDDDTLLAAYDEPTGRDHVIGADLIYDELKKDRDQWRKKYGHQKGKATQGLIKGSLFPQVEHRPLSFYENFSQGGVAWIN